jgi:hypothetical protein
VNKGNVVIEDERDFEILQKWAKTVRARFTIVGTIESSGKQSPKGLNVVIFLHQQCHLVLKCNLYLLPQMKQLMRNHRDYSTLWS